jgi:hypothetical protein
VEWYVAERQHCFSFEGFGEGSKAETTWSEVSMYDGSYPGLFVVIFSLAFLVNLLASLGVAAAAAKKGRSYAAFFFISFFFSFLLAFVIVASLAPIQNESGRQTGRSCPYCDEPVSLKAIVCRHCGRDIEEVNLGVDGTATETFLSKSDWILRFQEVSRTLPTFYPEEELRVLHSINENLIWTKYQDNEGAYLLNGFTAPSDSEPVLGWYVTEKPWVSGRKYVIELP